MHSCGFTSRFACISYANQCRFFFSDSHYETMLEQIEHLMAPSKIITGLTRNHNVNIIKNKKNRYWKNQVGLCAPSQQLPRLTMIRYAIDCEVITRVTVWLQVQLVDARNSLISYLYLLDFIVNVTGNICIFCIKYHTNLHGFHKCPGNFCFISSNEFPLNQTLCLSSTSPRESFTSTIIVW